MRETLVVIFGIIVVLTIGYYLLVAFFNILKKLIEGSQGALKGIFILIGLIGIMYTFFNQDQCPEIIDYIKNFSISELFNPVYYDKPVVKG